MRRHFRSPEFVRLGSQNRTLFILDVITLPMTGWDDNFERLRRNLGGGLEEYLRQFQGAQEELLASLRTLDGEWEKLQARVQDARRSGAATTPKTTELWDQRRILHELSVVGRLGVHGLRELPKELQIPGVRPIFDRMMQDTQRDGRERGRFGFIDLGSGKLVMGETTVGEKTSVSVSSAPPRGYRGLLLPVLDVHTHPSAPFEPARLVEHLSPTDFQSSLSGSQARLSIVLTKGTSLLIAKTLDTPRRVDEREFAERLIGLQESADRSERAALRRGNIEMGHFSRALTKLLCREYRLQLYMAQASDRGVFKRVSLD